MIPTNRFEEICNNQVTPFEDGRCEVRHNPPAPASCKFNIGKMDIALNKVSNEPISMNQIFDEPISMNQILDEPILMNRILDEHGSLNQIYIEHGSMN